MPHQAGFCTKGTRNDNHADDLCPPYLLQADADNLFDDHARAVSPLLIGAP